MKSEFSFAGILSFAILGTVFLFGFLILAVRLKDEQVDFASLHRSDMQSQSFRRIQTVGMRGRILDRNGVALAENVPVVNVAVNPEEYKARRRGETTLANLTAAIEAMSAVIGRKPSVSEADIRTHLRQALARPLLAWRNLTEAELARFSEHERDYKGFEATVHYSRRYPMGSLAAHVLGRVGRDRLPSDGGDTRMNFVDKEMCGRDGMELQYDAYLRGMPGEDRVYVDARGYAQSRVTVLPPQNGYDLRLTIDASLQLAAEKELKGCSGAFVAIDPRDGSVRAMASAPSFNPNECVPIFPEKVYKRYRDDPLKPLLNRATSGAYAPGSIFKLVTALAALKMGLSPADTLECIGYYELSGMKIRCGRTWGHGEMNLSDALKESCNPYFCTVGVRAGTNAMQWVAREVGLGRKTGLDYPSEYSGIIPDAAVKARLNPGIRWNAADLAQMSIGQGLLLVTPLQMALAVGAIGSGALAVPHLAAMGDVSITPIDVPEDHLEAVREGMRSVVLRGTGRKAGEGVDADVFGKTGTAEVGSRNNRRKNTWFVAYCTPTESSLSRDPIALAIVVENGDSGGSTAAPKVAAILKSYYGERIVK
ncbi:MAG: penicillin-binding protein 2 [Kiritimatiellae bacterium]|nr:penicillin-binding protein 2 [Kiritimatiellia bacterium]